MQPSRLKGVPRLVFINFQILIQPGRAAAAFREEAGKERVITINGEFYPAAAPVRRNNAGTRVHRPPCAALPSARKKTAINQINSGGSLQAVLWVSGREFPKFILPGKTR